MKKSCLHKFFLHRLKFIKSPTSLPTLRVCMLALGALLLLGSCMSVGDVKFDTAPLLGMVYDTENLPCQGASILVDGWERAQTDVNGRFALAEVARGKHTITVKKEGFETLTIPFNFFDRKEILYIKVISVKQLLEKTEQCIEEKRLSEAEAFLARAQVIEPANPVLLYMNSLLFIKKKDFTEAIKLLEQLVSLGYKEPIIYLTLADIYEFELFNYEKAALALEIYLKKRPHFEIEDRFKDLVKSYGLDHLFSKKAQSAQETEQNIPVNSNTEQPVNSDPEPPADTDAEQPVDEATFENQ